MPTCSQAKIITNLESDISKRFYRLSSNEAIGKTSVNYNEPETNIYTGEPISYQNSNVDSNQHTEILSGLNATNKASKNLKHELLPMPVQTMQFSQRKKSDGSIQPLNQLNSSTRRKSQSRRISIDDFPIATSFLTESPKRAQAILSDSACKKDSVPINFLYNSPYRTHRNSLTIQQMKINSLRSSLNLRNSDGEDDEENMSSENSDHSILSDGEVKIEKIKSPARKSVDFSQIIYKKKTIQRRENRRKTIFYFLTLMKPCN